MTLELHLSHKVHANYTPDFRSFGQKPIEAWLSRSGNLPLSIKICHINCDLSPTSPDDFVDIFIPFSSKWSNLHLDLPQSTVKRLVCNSGVSTPNLETLTLDIRLQDDIDSLALTQTAIRLRKITVLCGCLAPSYLELSWSQLTKFQSSSVPEVDDCLDLLKLCPNLTHLSLGDIANAYDSVSRPLVVMPRLSWLQLGSWYPTGLLLDNLVVPSLREIKLHGEWCKGELLSRIPLIVSTGTSQHCPPR